jgi:hypothetical protein
MDRRDVPDDAFSTQLLVHAAHHILVDRAVTHSYLVELARLVTLVGHAILFGSPRSVSARLPGLTGLLHAANKDLDERHSVR